MRIFFDTEFLEDGKTIDLISIGMVREDGQELYLVNREADWRSIYADGWLMENVVPHLPPQKEWVCRRTMSIRIRLFCESQRHNDPPEFWAYYADYDWVVLCQLFGRMIDLPSGWPMYCRDFKQWLDEKGLDAKKQETGQHDALCDARWLREEFTTLHGAGA